MTADELIILCNGDLTGSLRRDGRGRLSVVYDDTWRHRDDATPLSLSMPLAARTHPHRIVEPFLWGLLPDNNLVLARWARDFAVSAANPFALLANVGEDLPGAMQLVRPERVDRLKEGHIEWLETGQVADMLRTVREDQTAWLTNLSQGRWSLAGAQPKIALLHQDGRWGRPSGRVPTTHILKPAVAGLDEHDLNEHLCLRAAHNLGLRVAPTRVEAFEQERAIVVTRYDRYRAEDGTLMRIHQEDMCQALAMHPVNKYQSDGGPGPTRIVDLLRRHLAFERVTEAVDGFVGALAFNWIIAGPDAHAKNYAVLMAGGDVRLAPFYDIASALAYREFHEPKVKLAMKVGRYYRLASITRSSWQRLAEDLHLDANRLCTYVADLASRTPDALAAAVSDPDVASLRSELPARLVERVNSRARRLAADMQP